MSHKHVLWMIPVKPGKSEELIAFAREMGGARREQMIESEEQLNIHRELFFLWKGPAGVDYLALYMGGPDMRAALVQWLNADDEYTKWAMSTWDHWSDPETWPEPRWAGPGEPGMPELIFAYDKDND